MMLAYENVAHLLSRYERLLRETLSLVSPLPGILHTCRKMAGANMGEE
jgi:hypothetical protein